MEVFSRRCSAAAWHRFAEGGDTPDSLPCICHLKKIEVGFISSASPIISTYQVAVQPARSRGASAEFLPLFGNSLTAGKAAAAATRRITAAADWQVPSPGSAWGDAARPENDVGPSYSSGRYEATSSRKTPFWLCSWVKASRGAFSGSAKTC